MSIINSIQSMLPRPENRSRDQIARDLQDEFDFHLEMKARALQSEEGLDREAARGLAVERFGNLERIRKDCQRIALRERIMLQRVNLVLMIVVMLVVVAVGAQVYITQRYNTLALQAITADLTKMKFEAAAATRPQAGPGMVYLDGDVPRPGVYALPTAGKLTLSRALNAAGAATGRGFVKVVVNGSDPDGRSIVRYIDDHYALERDVTTDLVLSAGDRILVTAITNSDASTATTPTDVRAQAVGDFVVRLFALADPNDPNLDQTVRNFLDTEERAADAKYAGDPATAGMIKELIAARRKIFETDEAIQRATTAEQRTQAVTDFLEDVLSSADTTAAPVSVTDVLSHASSSVAQQFADNPEMAASIRQLLAQAQRNVEAQPGDKKAETAADQGEIRQDDDQFPKTSPFEEIRWKEQWTPVVRIQQEWYELVSLDGVAARAIVEHCRQRYGEERARKRFSEDLPQMLIEMNQQPGPTSKLQVKDMRTGSVLAINEAASSAENRESTRNANRVAEDAGKAYPEWTVGN